MFICEGSRGTGSRRGRHDYYKLFPGQAVVESGPQFFLQIGRVQIELKIALQGLFVLARAIKLLFEAGVSAFGLARFPGKGPDLAEKEDEEHREDRRQNYLGHLILI